jgi:hypothetical protein
LQYLDQFYDYGRNEDQLGWIPYQELFIDCWNTDLVTIESRVPARHAFLFGDGQQPFPNAELLGSGAGEAGLDRLRRGSLANHPVDISFGQNRARLAELPPDREVPVTWRATISEFIGEPHASLFQGLRQYGPDEDLRILSKRG